MKLRRCDLCNKETSNDWVEWSRISLRPIISGRERELDICETCTSRLSDLLEKLKIEII